MNKIAFCLLCGMVASGPAYSQDCTKVFDSTGTVISDPCSPDSYNPAWSKRTNESIKVVQNLAKQTPDYRNGWYEVTKKNSKSSNYWLAVKDHYETVNHPKQVNPLEDFRKDVKKEQEMLDEYDRGVSFGNKANAFIDGVRNTGYSGSISYQNNGMTITR